MTSARDISADVDRSIPARVQRRTATLALPNALHRKREVLSCGGPRKRRRHITDERQCANATRSREARFDEKKKAGRTRPFS